MASRTTRSGSKATNEDTASIDKFTDRIWSNLESKLNDWITDKLPALAEEILRMKVDECVNRAVEHFVSSETFKASLSESLTFDAKQMEDKVKAQEKETANLTSTIVQLEAQMNDLVTKQKSLEALNDQLEQYTRRTNIRIFGIPETKKQEKTDELVKQFCKNELDVELKSEDISRSHRVGRVSLATAHRPRPIIVRLTRHNKKVEILKRCRQLRINKKPFSV